MSGSPTETPGDEGTRWERHRVLAALLAFGIVLVPVLFAIAGAVVFKHYVARPGATGWLVLWWLAVLGTSTVAFAISERVARRALPLTILLKMGLLFPGQAPKRLAVARRATSTRELGRRLEEARTRGINDEPVLAAEKIVTLAVSLGAHDRVTRGHAERVRALTDLIADELHLAPDRRDRLRWSALLHDIGKLTVHPEVLNKPGALSDEEWEILRQHPLEGARITAPLAEWLGEWSQTIAEHHERFDGKGYPHGLAGREISLGGRIVAVADTYDVMTSVRAYKRAMSPTAAKTELAACAGSQFDPEIVRLFLGVSIRRLTKAVPFAWLGSFPFGNVAARLGSIGTAGGNIVVAGGLAGSAVLAVGISGAPIAKGAALRTPPAVVRHLSGETAPHGTGSSGSDPTGPGRDRAAGAPFIPASTTTTAPTSGSPQTGTTVPGDTATTTPGERSSTATPTSGVPGRPGTTTSSTGTTAAGLASASVTTTTRPGTPSGSTTTTGAGALPGSTTTTRPGTPSTTTSASASTTTTTRPTTTTSTSTTTTTAPPTTTTTPATTTTTTPPPAPPTGLTATASCAVIVLVPEVTLSWTASTTASVTSYDVLRSPNGSAYSAIATVTGRTSTGYTDSAVSEGTKYWYEVRATAPSGTATSGAASATTPSLCL